MSCKQRNEIPYNTTMQIAILGRQPKLGLAELESVCGASAVRPLGVVAAAVGTPFQPSTIGSVLKVAEKIAELPAIKWPKISELCQKKLPEILAGMPDGKLKLGLRLVFVKVGTAAWLGRTTWVQDVDDYAKRDFGRPHRDAFVGMLPPKL